MFSGKFKRIQILVKPLIQIRVGVFVFLITLLVSGTICWFFYYQMYCYILDALSTNPTEELFILKSKLEYIGKLSLPLVIFLPLLFGIWGGVIFSHAIVGPLYRIEKILKNWDGKSRLPFIRFRKRDILRFLEEAYNEAVKKCKQKNDSN